jgi:hypothetical protein
MGLFGRWLALLAFVATAVLILFFLLRRPAQAEFGPAVALCPGPDGYGYICAEGAGYAYLEATQDVALSDYDDGVALLELPFPFTFYGTTYTTAYASSNGNLQFSTANPAYGNACLDQGPAAEMGDMLAPYWTDLDLRFAGALQTAVNGQLPNRIFVVAWEDAPLYGNDLDDRVTFQVQLFEGSHDIVFLYGDVTTLASSNGRHATIGLQSAAQGLALQYSCNQPAVSDATRLRIVHPVAPNPDVGQAVVIERETAVTAHPAPRGPAAEALQTLSNDGLPALGRLRQHWLNQNPARMVAWQRLDLTGNGREELVMLWRGDRQHPELAQLAIFNFDAAAQPHLLWDARLGDRHAPLGQAALVETADLTGDGLPDLLLHDAGSGRFLVISVDGGAPRAYSVPERCRGNIGLEDTTCNFSDLRQAP